MGSAESGFAPRRAVEVADSRLLDRGVARAGVRARILEMEPVDLTGAAVSRRSALRVRSGTTQWAVVDLNGLTRAVRARDFADLRSVRRDLRDVLMRRADLSIIEVADDGGCSWWMALDHDVVLVGARVWGPRGSDLAARDARAALRTLSFLSAEHIALG